MRKIILGCFVLGMLGACNNDKPAAEEPKVKSAADTEKPPAEFADKKYTEWGMAGMKEFEKGNIEGWAERFADDVVHFWSAGDSVAGKANLIAYWKDRRANVIDSISFSKDIWLPILVNKSQQGPDMEGTWLMSWYQVHARYKTGKSLDFWVHNDYHYNSKDQVDRIIQYIDRAPINAATRK
jgi:hypothetical protein